LSAVPWLGKSAKHVIASLQEAETRRQMERIRQDLDTARGIQQDLLPRLPPASPRFDIAGWNQPADATGGDYFDWQELADGRIAVSLADVSGHGIGPALVMAVCRAYARASFPSARDLPEVMTRLNELLVKDLPSERYVTMVVAWLAPGKFPVRVDFRGTRAAPALPGGQRSVSVHRTARNSIWAVPRVSVWLTALLRDGARRSVSADDGWIFRMGQRATTNSLGWRDYRNPFVPRAISKSSEIIAQLHAAVVKFAGGTTQQD
jgi:hypothetical protein